MLRALTGVELSQGAISQDALRRARGAVGNAYHKLRGSVRASPLVHTDDTGWRVDGGPAFLMAFETDEATVYQVRARHRNEEVREVVPSDYGGVMVTDRGRSYDAQALPGVKQRYHAVGVALNYGLRVASLRRYWCVLDEELVGPSWELERSRVLDPERTCWL